MISVFLFSHPDDEFAVYPLIEKEAAVPGRRVFCFFLTDGGFGQQDPLTRIRESRSVLFRLGVGVESVFFSGYDLGIPDGALHTRLKDVFDELVLRLDNIANINSIYIPAWEGGHQDHDAAHVIGLAIAVRYGLTGRTFQFPIYSGAGLAGPFFRVMTPLPANGAIINEKMSIKNRFRFLAFCLVYRSQIRTWTGLFLFVMIRYIFIGEVHIQLANIARISEPPHPGRLLYERRGFSAWNDFWMHVNFFAEKNICVRGL